ncbi:MAG TPA: S-layer homology domain-containing protein [Thermoanaerobaculia bacterium]|nr:S-layer homology domain-containing protein [Thermoanaerobaculia bacterium]
MRSLAAILPGLLLAACLSGATVIVNDAGDATNACAASGTGTCTLRDALTYANAHAGSTIAFDIPGSGVHTITPLSAYPSLSAPMTIDGFTQPGSSPNSNGPGLGDNSVHLIEIDGTHACGAAAVLDFGTGSDASVIRGLVINRCNASAIRVAFSTTTGHVIEGNFLGTDPTGSVASPNSYGVLIDIGPKNVTIGGVSPASRNVISGNAAGIGFGNGSNNGGSGHVVAGNFIGTDAAGTGALPNSQIGISMASNISGSTIGGNTPSARNVISGNTGGGVGVSNGLGDPTVTNNVIEGNYIGMDVTGAAPLGNGTGGVFVGGPANTIRDNVIAANLGSGISNIGGNGTVIEGNLIGADASGAVPFGNHDFGIYLAGSNAVVGGVNAGEGNVIVSNGKGILVINGNHNAIRGNAIDDVSGLGIDLGSAGNADGVTPNDAGDGDTGANDLQNFPLVSNVTYGANTAVSGILRSTASTTFDLDFYSNPACSNFPREFLQGAVFLGTSQVTTDGAGNAAFDVTTLPATADGSRISVTATDPSGNTSEFSQRLPFSIDVGSGPPSGGTALTISGTDFAAGATVTIGGQPATDVNVASAVSMTATTPALAPGSANDLVVTNLDGTNGRLVKAFVADFLDVPPGNQFRSFVTQLVSNAITAGIGGGLYGVNDNTLRQQMAVFLLKAKHGLCYTPPPCAGVFADVPCSSNFAPWIEAMAAEGITGGCGGGNFCPQNPVRRDQMAVFLLKAEHGSSYAPPPCAGTFPDVPCPSTFAAWIEQLAAEMITGGCGGGNYCPGNPNTRGQMAVFITKTFGLQ